MGLVPCIIAGCGPGTTEFITPQVNRVVAEAELLTGAPRLLELFPSSRIQHLAYSGGLRRFLQDLTPHMGNRRIVVLVSGDPGIASLAGTISKYFPNYPIQRLPGISSVQLAFAKIGIDWMNAMIIRGHGSPPPWNAAWESHRGPFALLAGEPSIPILAAKLAEYLGRGCLWRCERLGMPNESITRLTPKQLKTEGCSSLSVIIVEGSMS